MVQRPHIPHSPHRLHRPPGPLTIPPHYHQSIGHTVTQKNVTCSLMNFFRQHCHISNDYRELIIQPSHSTIPSPQPLLCTCMKCPGMPGTVITFPVRGWPPELLMLEPVTWTTLGHCLVPSASPSPCHFGITQPLLPHLVQPLFHYGPLGRILCVWGRH